MTSFAKLSVNEQQVIIIEVADRRSVTPTIIEKDVWVCATLETIFRSPEYGEHFVFKGGTSLSKVYDAIRRFSEDIDLVMDWGLIGYRTDRVSQPVGVAPAGECRLKVEYPALFPGPYVRDHVLLEIGPLASWVPSTRRQIRPYVSEVFADAMETEVTEVTVTTAERTFWEKATILHQQAFSDRAAPSRYSRHYSDIVSMAKLGIADVALSDLALLRSVTEFKSRFYPSASARYDLAVPGTFRLLPDTHKLDELKRDYANMRVMFFDEPVPWPGIVDELGRLERSINSQEMVL